MRTQSALFGLCLSLAASGAMAADSWKTMPVSDAGYKPDFTLSVLGGYMHPRNAKGSGVFGAELDFNCLLLQPPSGIIRSQLSIHQFDHGGLTLTTYELSPRWTTEIDKNLTLGIGPGIGYVDAELAGQTKGMWAGQLGGDLNYRMGNMTLGLTGRWQLTTNTQVAAGYKKNEDNVLLEAKVGYNF